MMTFNLRMVGVGVLTFGLVLGLAGSASAYFFPDEMVARRSSNPPVPGITPPNKPKDTVPPGFFPMNPSGPPIPNLPYEPIYPTPPEEPGVPEVPEPTSLLTGLIGLGLAGAYSLRRRRSN